MSLLEEFKKSADKIGACKSRLRLSKPKIFSKFPSQNKVKLSTFSNGTLIVSSFVAASQHFMQIISSYIEFRKESQPCVRNCRKSKINHVLKVNLKSETDV